MCQLSPIKRWEIQGAGSVRNLFTVTLTSQRWVQLEAIRTRENYINRVAYL